jgi:hypothetical protein
LSSGSDPHDVIVILRTLPHLLCPARRARERRGRLTRQKNLAKREELQKKAAAARPHVILGTIVSNDKEACAKWAACDLAEVLVRPEELAHDAPAQRASGNLNGTFRTGGACAGSFTKEPSC